MNTVTATPDRVSLYLYYREGSSDKVYQAAIEPADHQFAVNFAYPRQASSYQPDAAPAGLPPGNVRASD